MKTHVFKNLTASKLAEELDDARYQIRFWRIATRLNVVALRNHRRFTIGTSARRISGNGFEAGWQEMLETDIREGLTRYRRAQARLRILNTAPNCNRPASGTLCLPRRHDHHCHIERKEPARLNP